MPFDVFDVPAMDPEAKCSAFGHDLFSPIYVLGKNGLVVTDKEGLPWHGLVCQRKGCNYTDPPMPEEK